MNDLPAVKNDHENIRQTVLMMGVPDSKENIFEIRDGTWNQMNELESMVDGQVKCRTKELKNETGVGDELYEKGFLWDRIKENAMLDESNDDFVVVSFCLFITPKQMDLTSEEYEFIHMYCLPESKEKVTSSIRLKKKCGFTWRNLTKNLKEGVFTIESK